MIDSILWDLEDDPLGNVQHIAEHGLGVEDVEYALERATRSEISISTGNPLFVGPARDGRDIVVVYELIDSATIRPITAFYRQAEP